MESDAAITWIHLSDFHAGQRGESAWHAIDVAFEANVRKLARRLGKPDLVLFTGDLANWGGRDKDGNDEYAKVDRVLERLNEWLGVEVPVFAIPGNHDLVRPKKPWDYSAFLHYEEDPNVREALWTGDDELRGRLERLLPHYTEWMQRRVVGSLRNAGWKPHVSTRMPGDLSVIVEKHGVRLGLVGLNSAWTHLSDEGETRGLQLPPEQLHAALPPTAGNPLDWFRGGQPSFLLMHHPPGWLSEKARATYDSEICPPGRFALTLFGHMHEGRSESRDRSATGRRTDYQSPSLFGLEHYGTAKERKSFGYTWGRITSRGEVRVWPQRVVQRDGGRLVFDRDQGFGADEDELEGVVLVEGAPVSAALDVTMTAAARTTAAQPAEPAGAPTVALGWQDPIPPEELKRYLAKAEAIHQDVPLIGFKTKARLSMQLRELYVPLGAVIDRGGRGRDVSASAEVVGQSKAHDASLLQEEIALVDAFHRARALGNRRGLVLLGDPGSGKTTHLAQVLLKVVRDEPESIGLPAGTVPVLLPLRKLEDREAGLPGFIQRQLKGPVFGMKPDFGQRLCERGKLLLLLDGLDEVANAEERAAVSRWIEAALVDLPDSYVLVSCRYAGYKGSVELHERFLELHLRPFDKEQMGTFVKNWYATVERELRVDPEQAAIHAERGAKELLEILESQEFTTVGKIFEMTRNPLLLTTLCLVHRDLGRLPHARAKLYEEAVAVLLERWRHRGNDGDDALIAADEAMEVLRPIARWMHEQRRTRATKAELVEPASEGLAKLRHVELGAEAFLQAIRDESGLLTGWSGDEYGFMHLGFQELLAAQELRNRGLKDPKVFEALAERFGDSWWQEVILLMLALRSPSVFEELMRAVVRRPEFEQWAHSEMMAFVFAEAAEVSEVPFLELLRLPAREGMLGQRHEVIDLLARRMPEVFLREPELMRRFQSSIINGLFEDVRRGAVRGSEPRRGLEAKVVHGVELVLVPGGRFLMGSPEGEQGRDADEVPQHEVELAGFWLARAPVTNAQYREYMRANPGVKEPQFWGDRRYNQDEQPVVGVSWDEAKAYCEWAGLLLPTEAQWEYACRAGTTTRYSSGDSEEDLAKVGWYGGNSGGRLHAVGELEPNGWGLYDMHGNVWEWCEDTWVGNYEGAVHRAGDGLRTQPVGDANRVMRGGRFDYGARYAQSAYRSYRHPGDRGQYVGFRAAQGHP